MQNTSSEEIIEAPLYDLTDNFSIHVLRKLCEKYWIYDIKGKHVGIESDCPELIDYMNIFFAQFQHPISYAFRNNRRDRYRFITSQEISHITKSCVKITYPASSLYTKHIDSLVYDKTDFIIDFDGSDVINEVWEDTNVSKGLTVYNLYQRPQSISHPDIQSRASIIFDFILTVICDSNQELHEFILKWIAHILQNGKSGLALVLMGDFGCGEGTFSQLLIAIFGLEYTYTDVCGSRIESRFNGHEEGKLLGIMEELSNNNAEHHTRAEIMKSKITDKESMIEKKNVEVYPSTNNCNYVFITNGQNPVKIEDNQRRYIALRVNNLHQQDHQYFDKLVTTIKQEKFHLRDYFQNYTVEKSDMKVIDTEANCKRH